MAPLWPGSSAVCGKTVRHWSTKRVRGLQRAGQRSFADATLTALQSTQRQLKAWGWGGGGGWEFIHLVMYI